MDRIKNIKKESEEYYYYSFKSEIDE